MNTIINVLAILFYSCNGQKLIIEFSGLVNFGENDNGMVFFIQVVEEGPTSSRIFVNHVECCETISDDKADCDTIRLIGGDMDIKPYGIPRNLTLFYPTLYGYNRHGSCLVDIMYNANKTKLRHKIEFDTIIRTDGVPNGLEPFYNPSEIIPCSSLDLDPFNACEPVICQTKYGGTRNYFNRELNRCDKAAVCEEGQVYIAISNICRNVFPSVTDDELRNIAEQLPIGRTDDEQEHLICHKGRYEKGTCICDPGWMTVRTDDCSVSTFHFCNVPCPGSVFESPSNFLFHIFDIIFALFIVGLIFICVCCMDKRHTRKRNDYYNDSTNVLYYKALPK